MNRRVKSRLLSLAAGSNIQVYFFRLKPHLRADGALVDSISAHKKPPRHASGARSCPVCFCQAGPGAAPDGGGAQQGVHVHIASIISSISRQPTTGSKNSTAQVVSRGNVGAQARYSHHNLLPITDDLKYWTWRSIRCALEQGSFFKTGLQERNRTTAD